MYKIELAYLKLHEALNFMTPNPCHALISPSSTRLYVGTRICSDAEMHLLHELAAQYEIMYFQRIKLIFYRIESRLFIMHESINHKDLEPAGSTAQWHVSFRSDQPKPGKSIITGRTNITTFFQSASIDIDFTRLARRFDDQSDQSRGSAQYWRSS